MNILAIDDSKLICTMLKNVLSGAGHTITIAGDGKEGVNLATSTQFDLVITDINMPEMNGLDLARHLRNTDEYKTTPIIFLTTEASEEFRAKGKEIKGTHWISKPFSPINLLTLFNSIFKKMNILAVDDSKSIRCMVNNVLTGAGHTVTVANDGKEAVSLAMDSGFDLIITDVNMPEMDGLELAKQLRNSTEYQSTPIIFLTTETSEAFKTKGKELGASTWITKPFSPVNLLEVVNTI